MIYNLIPFLLCHPDARRAVKYVTPKLVVKATRRHRRDRRSQHEEFVVTVGTPNFRERAFIKQCLRAGERFPVKRVQVQAWPSRRAA
jgi:hypothetical protein